MGSTAHQFWPSTMTITKKLKPRKWHARDVNTSRKTRDTPLGPEDWSPWKEVCQFKPWWFEDAISTWLQMWTQQNKFRVGAWRVLVQDCNSTWTVVWVNLYCNYLFLVDRFSGELRKCFFFGRILEFSSLITHQIYLRFASLIYLFFVNCSFNLLMLSCILFIFLLTLFFVKFDCNLGLISYICGLFL